MAQDVLSSALTIGMLCGLLIVFAALVSDDNPKHHSIYNAEKQNITFADVIGAEKAKSALNDIVQALKNPEAYAQVGAHLPKGVLLEGEPGNGKTLLAKALAGEAGVSFIAINGSEFSDKYMGVGIQRVQQLFKKARQHAPCIIFIDEIDGIGKRTDTDHPAGKEDNRIITELLTQMDGLTTDPAKPIIIVGATNHRNLLDKALLRSGRFDTIVTVESPAQDARKAILQLYAKKINAEPLDFTALAEQSEGFSGADLANLVNQAALIAARKKAKTVQEEHFQHALQGMLETRGHSEDKNPLSELFKMLAGQASPTPQSQK